MDPDTVNLSLSPEQAYFILLRAREFDEKVEDTDPDSGSNASDDGAVDVLEDNPDDTTEAELTAAVRRLNDDELRDLIALIWIGRGDFSAEEWDDARNAASDIGRERAPRYVRGIPLVSDYLEEGLSELGFSLADYVDTH
ncbi:MAG TPA: DUF3775 domain-containing protein [Caulobacteraceae bacterium]|nr:DUF3775 domain-containing protein [Caulobacteraceae bacterium]